MTKRLEVFRIEGKGLLEHGTCLSPFPGFMQGLPEHDVSTHVLGLPWQELAAEGDRLRQISRLTELVRQGGEVAAWIVRELDPEFVDPGSCAHPSSAQRVMVPSPVQGPRAARAAGVPDCNL